MIKNYIITINDLYISIAGTIGKTGIIPNELNGANLTENAARLVYKNSEKQDNKFVYYFTKSSTFNEQIEDATKTVAQPKLALTRLSEVEIPLPPLEEQKRIVAKIDAAFKQLDEAISLQKNNIFRTETLKKALLVEQFSELPYEKKKLGEIANLITKGSSPTWQGVNYIEKSDNSILFITSENVGSFEILTKNMKYVEAKFNKIEPRSILKKGDILMNIVGASIGRTAIYNLDEVANINQAVCLIRLNENKINSQFALQFFNSPICIELMFDKQVDNARANLSMGSIKNFEIPLPPIAEQEKIVAYLDKSFAEIDKMLEAQKTRLAHLEGMKKAILQEAFEGKL